MTAHRLVLTILSLVLITGLLVPTAAATHTEPPEDPTEPPTVLGDCEQMLIDRQTNDTASFQEDGDVEAYVDGTTLSLAYYVLCTVGPI